MSYALAQITELPLETYNSAAKLNTAPKAANLNRAPYHSPLEHYVNSDGRSVYMAYDRNCNAITIRL